MRMSRIATKCSEPRSTAASADVDRAMLFTRAMTARRIGIYGDLRRRKNTATPINARMRIPTGTIGKEEGEFLAGEIWEADGGEACGVGEVD